MCASEDARESDSVHGGAADLEERRAIRIARLGRKLPGEWGVGGAVGFVGPREGQDRTGPQDRIAILREAWPGGNDVRAARDGAWKDSAKLTEFDERNFLVLSSFCRSLL